MQLRIEHDCGAEEARRRLEQVAHAHGIEVQREGDGGRLSHRTALGAVAARYVVLEGSVEVVVERKPAFLSEGLVRRKIEEGLREMLAGRDR